MSESHEREIRELRSLYWSERDPDGRGFAPLADACRRSGDLDEARELVEEGLERLPHFASGHVVAARVHLELGDALAASSALDRVLELDGENTEALHRLGVIREEQGRTADALELFKRLATVDPGDLNVIERIASLEDSLDLAGETRYEAPGELDSAAAADTTTLAAEAVAVADWSEEDLEEDVHGSGLAALDAPEEASTLDAAREILAESTPAHVQELEGEAPQEASAELGAPRHSDDWGTVDTTVDEPTDEAMTAAEEPLEPEAEPEWSAELQAEEEVGTEAEWSSELRAEEPVEAEPEWAVEAQVEEKVEAEAEWSSEPEVEDTGETESDWTKEIRDEATPFDLEEDDALGSEDVALDLGSLAAAGLESLEMEPGVWGTDEPEPPDLEGEIYTRTLAELYADQGLYRRAADVLRRLVEDDPLDDELRSRLEEMEALTEAPEPTTTELASEVDGVAEAAEPTPDEDTTVQLAELGSGPSLDEQRLDEDLEVLAADLGTTPDAGPDVSTPFAWSESEVEVAAEDEGRPVADYFADLLAWEPREPLAEDVPVAADVTEAEGVSALEEPTQTVDLPATEEAEAVEIGSLAPGETVVPIESLAPDPAPTAPSEEEEQRVAEFKDWMRRLGK